MNFYEIAIAACDRHGAMQRPDEFTTVLDLVAAAEPKVIVEIGCMIGGTLYAWRQICEDVYAITLPNPHPDYPISHGATVLKADSHSPESLAWLRAQIVGREIDVLHIDGDHTFDGVSADWEMYSPLVRAGGLILINDIANDRDAQDVGRFWRQLSVDHTSETVIAGVRPIGFGIITKEISERGTPSHVGYHEQR